MTSNIKRKNSRELRKICQKSLIRNYKMIHTTRTEVIISKYYHFVGRSCTVQTCNTLFFPKVTLTAFAGDDVVNLEKS